MEPLETSVGKSKDLSEKERGNEDSWMSICSLLENERMQQQLTDVTEQNYEIASDAESVNKANRNRSVPSTKEEYEHVDSEIERLEADDRTGTGKS